MRRSWGLALLLPWLVGFGARDPRAALEAVYHNLYAPGVFAGIELEIHDPEHGLSRVAFGYGRKRAGAETKTFVYVSDVRRPFWGALVLQKSGVRDLIYVAEGRYGQARPLAGGGREWSLFGSDFNYEDFRSHQVDEYQVRSLGADAFKGEPCQVLLLRPRSGPYRMLLVWVSTRRPVILRTDLFDEHGLWKRRTARPERIIQSFEWWVPMEEEMVDLRTGRRSIRRIRNLLVDVEVPDEIFTLTRLERGQLPSF